MIKQYLAPPPRRVSLFLRLQILFSKETQGALVFLLFGLIIFFFVGLEPIASYLSFSGELETTQGKSAGRDKNKLFYSFNLDGKRYQSYSHGNFKQIHAKMMKNVIIEFPKGNPDVSRIKGMRKADFTLWASIVIIIPLIGIFYVIISVIKKIKPIRLLSKGKLALAELKSKNENDKITFKFTADNDKTYDIKSKVLLSHELKEKLKNDKYQTLYYPSNPSYNLMLNAITLRDFPVPFSINDKTGKIQSKLGIVKAFFGLVLPSLVIALVCLSITDPFSDKISTLFPETSIHEAVEQDDYLLIHKILNRGGDVNARDKDGKTPLHVAAEKDKINIVYNLIGKGADVMVKDNMGKIPLDLAKNTKIIKFLRKKMNIIDQKNYKKKNRKRRRR